MLDPVLQHWLEANAEALDQGRCDPQQVLGQLAAAKVLGVGVDPRQGGSGASVADAGGSGASGGGSKSPIGFQYELRGTLPAITRAQCRQPDQ